MTVEPLAAAALAQRVTLFWQAVDRRSGPNGDGCWLWTGYVNPDGYGEFYWNGKMVGAHELAVTFTTGEVRAPGLDTCHGCGTRLCVNPGHIRFDTRQSNVDDMLAHGTHQPGPAKLTDAQVVTIRERAARGATGKALAAEYNVSRGLVTEIIRGNRRKRAGGPIRTEHGNRKVTTP